MLFKFYGVKKTIRTKVDQVHVIFLFTNLQNINILFRDKMCVSCLYDNLAEN
jgi:hypothetical protein